MNDVRDWSLDINPLKWMFSPVQQEMKVRFSIFIITGVCAGLPALVWSVSDIIHHRKNGLRISIFIILLLLSDFPELYLSPYILIKDLLNELVSNTHWTCKFVRVIWMSSRFCGFLLNQVVAIDGILKCAMCSTSVFFSPGCVIFSILVFLCITIGSFWLNLIIFQIYIFNLIFIAVILFIITLVISCTRLCSSHSNFHTSRKPDRHICVFYLFSLLIYISYFLSFFTFLVENIHVILLSLRLISDPLLCVLVCRQNLSLQNSQNPEESQVQSA